MMHDVQLLKPFPQEAQTLSVTFRFRAVVRKFSTWPGPPEMTGKDALTAVVQDLHVEGLLVDDDACVRGRCSTTPPRETGK